MVAHNVPFASIRTCDGKMLNTLELTGPIVTSIYRIKLLFDWGGGAIWADSDMARARFGVGPIEDQLGLSPALHERLDTLSAWHDGALDWNDPTGNSPWTAEERVRFDQAARLTMRDICRELGPTLDLHYVPL
jgi:hypothetical protein